MDHRAALKNKKKIVVKVGSSTITHSSSGDIDLDKLERFVRVLIGQKNSGRRVTVVSSGAVAAGRRMLGMAKPETLIDRQACAAVGQARLMMIYEKFFGEYGERTAQILLTRESIENETCARNARNTFDRLMELGVVPIVNENDAVSVDEFMYGNFGDNDTLAAYVTRLIGADLLILLSDIEGLYTDDPRKDPNARFIHTVTAIDEKIEAMAKGAGSDVGTGGMATKIRAAKIATSCGADMVIANGDSVYVINSIMSGKRAGTLFLAPDRAPGEVNELEAEPTGRKKIKRRSRNDNDVREETM